MPMPARLRKKRNKLIASLSRLKLHAEQTHLKEFAPHACFQPRQLGFYAF